MFNTRFYNDFGVLGNNKKPINKFFIFCFITSIFLAFCNNKSEENGSLENGWKQHELIMYGKRISFILPDYYVHTDTCDNIRYSISSGCLKDTIYAFCSMKNSENYFMIGIEPVYDNELSIDSFFKTNFYYYTAQDMVPFFERRRDKNNRVFYLTMASTMEKFSEQSDSYIYTIFSYKTIIGEKWYTCGLSTYDPIDNNFSYEEKRKIIESVRIEDIK